MKKYDLVVIGSGPAGEKAAAKAAYFGHSVALVEKEDSYGGAGVQTGTLPSKTLKETAVYFSRVYEKGIYSLDRDFSRKAGVRDFLYRKDVVTDDFGKSVKKNIIDHGIDIFKGTASFVDEHQIKIEGFLEEIIYGEYIIIATGSYPFQPKEIPFDGVKVHDSDSILAIRKFPKSMCVLGAGVIGCEYATIFAAMGVKVFIVNNRDKILGFLDEDVSEGLVKQMSENEIEILFNNSISNFHIPDHPDGELELTLETGEVLKVDMFLFAAGRSGNIRSLNIEKAGLKVGSRETLIVNDKFQTNVSHIYAVGDVIGFPALASTSMEQGRIAVANIFETEDLEEISSVFPYGIYTIPEVSMVGITEQEAREKGVSYCTGKCHYRNTARGKIQGVNDDSFLKLIFDRETKQVLGVHIIGLMGTELIHYGMYLVENRVSLDQVIAKVFNYPTFHDLYKYAAYDGLGNLSGHKIKDET